MGLAVILFNKVVDFFSPHILMKGFECTFPQVLGVFFFIFKFCIASEFIIISSLWFKLSIIIKISK